MVNKNISFGNRLISEAESVFIIAEAGVNHNGDLNQGKQLIKEAARCGADCVKFQTFKADRVVTPSAPKANYQLKVTSKQESQLAMLEVLELNVEQHIELQKCCEENNILFLSTPYNLEDIDLLSRIGVDAYKIASGQIIELVFLKAIAQQGKPIFLSTGMATLREIDEAIDTIVQQGNDQLVLLQCTTNYPSKIGDANLKVIPTLKQAFGYSVGYSDHTMGCEAVIAAVAIGAAVIEKHFTLDKSLPGPDHSCSATPDELEKMVRNIRNVELAIGTGIKKPTAEEVKNSTGMRRSIVASQDIQKGDRFNSSNITFKRPATGLAPRYFEPIIGKRSTKNIIKNELLQMDMVEW